MASLSSHRLGLHQWGKSHDPWTCLDPQNSDQASRVLNPRPFCNPLGIFFVGLTWTNMNKSSLCLNPKHSEHWFLHALSLKIYINVLTALQKPCASWQLAENVCYLGTNSQIDQFLQNTSIWWNSRICGWMKEILPGQGFLSSGFEAPPMGIAE